MNGRSDGRELRESSNFSCLLLHLEFRTKLYHARRDVHLGPAIHNNNVELPAHRDVVVFFKKLEAEVQSL